MKLGLSLAALSMALWTLPLLRAVSFFLRARADFQETRSINSANDLRFSEALLGSYSISLLCCLALAVLISRRPRFRNLATFAPCIYAGGVTILRKPESEIVLFPTMSPWLPVAISLSSAAIGMIVYFGALQKTNGPRPSGT